MSSQSRDISESRPLIAVLLIASMLTIMLDTVLSPALPGLRENFSNVENIDFLARIILTFPSIFVAACAPIYGVLVDRVGRTRILYIATIIYGVGGGSGYVLESIPLLLASRALLGIGAAGVFVAATTLLTDYFVGDDRDTVLGWQGAATVAGGIVFLTVGGYLASIDWQTPFLIYASVLVLVPFMIILIDEPKRTDADASDASESGATSTLDSIRELLTQLPLGTVAVIYAIGVIVQIVFFTIPVDIPFYLESVTSVGETLTGLAIAAATLTGALMASRYQQIKNRLGIIGVVAIMFALMGVGLVVVSLGSTYAVIVVGTAITGLGTGLQQPNLTSWIGSAVPDDLRGRALGGLTSSFFIGQFLSPVVSEPISSAVGLGTTFAIGGVVFLALAIISLGVQFGYHPDVAGGQEEQAQATEEPSSGVD